jgi:hypothetical protein
MANTYFTFILKVTEKTSSFLNSDTTAVIYGSDSTTTWRAKVNICERQRTVEAQCSKNLRDCSNRVSRILTKFNVNSPNDTGILIESNLFYNIS